MLYVFQKHTKNVKKTLMALMTVCRVPSGRADPTLGGHVDHGFRGGTAQDAHEDAAVQGVPYLVGTGERSRGSPDNRPGVQYCILLLYRHGVVGEKSSERRSETQ